MPTQLKDVGVAKKPEPAIKKQLPPRQKALEAVFMPKPSVPRQIAKTRGQPTCSPARNVDYCIEMPTPPVEASKKPKTAPMKAESIYSRKPSSGAVGQKRRNAEGTKRKARTESKIDKMRSKEAIRQRSLLQIVIEAPKEKVLVKTDSGERKTTATKKSEGTRVFAPLPARAMSKRKREEIDNVASSSSQFKEKETRVIKKYRHTSSK